jgi:hypothetical protein
MVGKNSYVRSIIILSIIQIFGLWHGLIEIANQTNSVIGETIAAFLSLPFIITFPIGSFLLLVVSGLYSFIWFWLEPIIYLSKTAKLRNSNYNRLHTLKLISYVVIPIIVFYSSSTNKNVNELSDPEYFVNNYPRCSHPYGNPVPNEKVYLDSCNSKQACTWEYESTNEKGDMYSCCPIDEKERNAEYGGGYLYPECRQQ